MKFDKTFAFVTYSRRTLLTYGYLISPAYENEVSLRGQNPPLKCCQPLKILTCFKMELELNQIKNGKMLKFYELTP